MFAIFVKASWLAEIGDMQVSLVRESGPPRDVVSLLAAEVHVSYPFIGAKIARMGNFDSLTEFMSVSIPADAVRGIFDLTEGEEKKYGFIRS